MKQALRHHVVISFLVDWIETTRDDFEGKELERFPNRIRNAARQIFDRVTSGDVMSRELGKVRE